MRIKSIVASAVIILLASLGSATALAQPCVAPPAGLVSWWPGDGNATDIVDGNNGTLENGATFGTGFVTSGNGQAFSFDGVDDRIVVPNDPSLDLTQAFTIDAWVNFADVNSTHFIVCKGNVDNHQYCLTTGDGAAPDELELLVRRAATTFDGQDKLITVNQANLVPNRWYHIVGTADGTNKSIYLDGVLLAFNSAAGPYNSNSNPVEIGSANQGLAPAFFSGLIDELEIYNRALSAAEILAIFTAGIAGKCKPVTPVDIDIKPGSDPNSINLCNQGNVTVAILSTPTFDATTVDPDTATLADADVRTVGKSNKQMARIEDVDGDGDLDLVMQFATVDLALSLGTTDTEATLNAQTFGGQAVTGTDAIRIVKDCP